MDKEAIYTIQQTFDDRDYLALKQYLGAGGNGEGAKQVCLALMILLVCAVISTFHTYSTLSVIVWVVTGSICMLLYYISSNYQRVSAMVFKALFSSQMMESVLFFETFLCAKRQDEMLLVEYEQIKKIEENERLFILTTTIKNHRLLFLKKDARYALHAVRYVEKKKEELYE